MNERNEMAEMMEMGEGAMGARVAMPLCDRTITHEIAEEVILPEDQPAIRRILSVRGRILPPAKYVGSGNAEWNGTVEYSLLYVTGNGALCEAAITAEYGFGVPLETGGREFDFGEGVCCFVSTSTDQLSARMSGSGRVNLRHRMRSRVRVYGQMLLSETVQGMSGEDGIRRRMAETKRMCPAVACSEPISLREEIPLPSENSRVVSAQGGVFISSVSPREDGLQVSGEVLLKWMTERDGEVEISQRKIPFEGEIDGEDFSREGTACAEGTVSGLTVTVEDGRALCEGEVILSARGMSRMPLVYTEDLYSTERDCVCEYEEVDIPVALKCENRNLSVSERIPLSEAHLPEGAKVLDAWAEPRVESCEAVGEKYVLAGPCRYVILCATEGDYSVSEVVLPWRCETDGAGMAPTVSDCSARMIHCRARADGDTLYLDGELTVRADYLGSERIRYVSGARLGEISGRRSNCMIVYYPMPGETPWDVAKKYQVPLGDLKGDIGSYFVF